MTRHDGTPSVSHHRVFPAQSLAAFARAYPETPHVLRHGLEADFRLSLDSLAQLGEALPGSSVEYNRGDLPIGVDGKPMILTGDFNFSSLQISHRMIGTTMATRHFMGLCTQRQRHQLMPNANTKNWHVYCN